MTMQSGNNRSEPRIAPSVTIEILFAELSKKFDLPIVGCLTFWRASDGKIYEASRLAEGLFMEGIDIVAPERLRIRELDACSWNPEAWECRKLAEVGLKDWWHYEASYEFVTVQRDGFLAGMKNLSLQQMTKLGVDEIRAIEEA